MEDVGRLCKVSNLHIAILVLTLELLRRWEDSRVFVAKLQVSLHAARRVLRALTIVTMGQVHDKATSLKPLDLARGDELIDDALCVVGEIAKLSFPHDESIGRRERVTVFEAESA